jgi:hypothetical protein
MIYLGNKLISSQKLRLQREERMEGIGRWREENERMAVTLSENLKNPPTIIRLSNERILR